MVSRSSAPEGGCRDQGGLVGCDGPARNRQHRLRNLGQVRARTSYPFLSDGNPQHASALGLVELGRPGMAAFTSGIGLRALAELVAAAPKTKRLLAEGMQSDDNVVKSEPGTPMT